MIRNGRDIIRSGYAAGAPVAEIARQCRSTPGSVKVIAHKMKLRHPAKAHLIVPPALMSDFRVLLDIGKYRAREAVSILGLKVTAP